MSKADRHQDRAGNNTNNRGDECKAYGFGKYYKSTAREHKYHSSITD